VSYREVVALDEVVAFGGLFASGEVVLFVKEAAFAEMLALRQLTGNQCNPSPNPQKEGRLNRQSILVKTPHEVLVPVAKNAKPLQTTSQ
jgi:hypothetical protein